jgi:hypothetical protein
MDFLLDDEDDEVLEDEEFDEDSDSDEDDEDSDEEGDEEVEGWEVGGCLDFRRVKHLHWPRSGPNEAASAESSALCSRS